jgi:hypothetical protein
VDASAVKSLAPHRRLRPWLRPLLLLLLLLLLGCGKSGGSSSEKGWWRPWE